METGMWVSVAAIGYVAGGVSFSRIVTRLLAPDVDLEKVTMPSGEGGKEERFRAVGATAASLKLGPRVGCTIGVGCDCRAGRGPGRNDLSLSGSPDHREQPAGGRYSVTETVTV
jgi:hypothetical protein